MAWEWIFFINVPLGLITAGIAVWAIDESRDPVTRQLDLSGLISSTVALSALTYALIEGISRGWTSTPILAAFAVAAVSGAGVRVDRAYGRPIRWSTWRCSATGCSPARSSR